jgi:hypothetical protein
MPAARKRAKPRPATCGLGSGAIDHDLGNTCADQRVAARARAALVGAGLQRDPGGGAAHIVPARSDIAQGHDFRMRTAGLLGVALAQHIACGAGDDAADPGVGIAKALGNRCPSHCQKHYFVKIHSEDDIAYRSACGAGRLSRP